MGFLERLIVRTEIDDGLVLSKWVRDIIAHLELSHEEKILFHGYFRGYLHHISSGEFERYQNSPTWKVLRIIPSVPQVVNAARTISRIGMEMKDEMEHLTAIYRIGGSDFGGVGNLAVAFASECAACLNSDKMSIDEFDRFKQKLIGIATEWSRKTDHNTKWYENITTC